MKSLQPLVISTVKQGGEWGVNTALERGTDLKAVISVAIVQLSRLNHTSQYRPSGRVNQQGPGDSFHWVGASGKHTFW